MLSGELENKILKYEDTSSLYVHLDRPCMDTTCTYTLFLFYSSFIHTLFIMAAEVTTPTGTLIFKSTEGAKKHMEAVQKIFDNSPDSYVPPTKKRGPGRPPKRKHHEEEQTIMVKVGKHDMARVYNTNTENRKKYVGFIEEVQARVLDFQHAMFTDLVGGNMPKPPGKPPTDSVFNSYTGIYMNYSDIAENIDKARSAIKDMKIVLENMESMIYGSWSDLDHEEQTDIMSMTICKEWTLKVKQIPETVRKADSKLYGHLKEWNIVTIELSGYPVCFDSTDDMLTVDFYVGDKKILSENIHVHIAAHIYRKAKSTGYYKDSIYSATLNNTNEGAGAGAAGGHDGEAATGQLSPSEIVKKRVRREAAASNHNTPTKK